jgi:8-oxo-dGTP pyrophosphatase MutT (NUDIX family)
VTRIHPSGWARSRLRWNAFAPSPESGAPPPREAAVLVLLIDGPDGVQVLLTKRALDLRHYPGEWVFPGGKKDSTDADSTATALREAREEVGLDGTSVHILGSLPTTVDPDGKSTVTPVLAWSVCPEFPGPVNSKEVADVRWVAIRDVSASGRAAPRSKELASLVSKLGSMTIEIIDAVVALLDAPTAKDPNDIHP